MPFPFGKSHKCPADIVKNLKESMAVLEKHDISDKKAEKATEEVSKSLLAMKEILYGSSEKEPQTEAVAQLAQELYNTGLLATLITHLQLIDFEGKKDVAQIFNNILRRQIGTRTPTVEYLCTQQNILFMLLKGYESPEIALNCGIMLRECIRHEPLAKITLWSEHFYNFFRYVEMSTFDIASDAFATFKDLLTRHKLLSAEFLEQHYDRFFSEYEKLLHSENYVTKRQSLKLLGELLLDRHNFTIMTKYISRPENLKLMMNLLRDKSRNIQFEAFHVFKVQGEPVWPGQTRSSLSGLCCLTTALIVFTCSLIYASVYIYRYYIIPQAPNQSRFHCHVLYENALSTPLRGAEELEENVGIFLQENYEHLTVPKFSNTDSANIIHDFNKGLTAYHDVELDKCYITELNSTIVMPPRNLWELLINVKLRTRHKGIYLPQTFVVQEEMVVTGLVSDTQELGVFIHRLCEKKETFHLKRRITRRRIFRREVQSCRPILHFENTFVVETLICESERE